MGDHLSPDDARHRAGGPDNWRAGHTRLIAARFSAQNWRRSQARDTNLIRRNWFVVDKLATIAPPPIDRG
jgi:hypothetical protein